MVQGRCKGFVVGCDDRDGKSVWKVRVKDPPNDFDGQKLVIASTHNGIELAQGLNVNFLIGSLDGERGEKVLRAVDVCLDNPQ